VTCLHEKEYTPKEIADFAQVLSKNKTKVSGEAIPYHLYFLLVENLARSKLPVTKVQEFFVAL